MVVKTTNNNTDIELNKNSLLYCYLLKNYDLFIIFKNDFE